MMADGGDLRTLQEYMTNMRYRIPVVDSDCDVPEDDPSDDDSPTEGDQPRSDEDVLVLQRYE